MKISNNFTLAELEHTNQNVINKADIKAVINLSALVWNVLQPIRDKFKQPIIINSGYRSKELNKIVSKKDESQHTRGEAADITSNDNLKLFYLILFNTDFDQLIMYDSGNTQPIFLHVSYKITGNRNQVLKAEKTKTGTKYTTFNYYKK